MQTLTVPVQLLCVAQPTDMQWMPPSSRVTSQKQMRRDWRCRVSGTGQVGLTGPHSQPWGGGQVGPTPSPREGGRLVSLGPTREEARWAPLPALGRGAGGPHSQPKGGGQVGLTGPHSQP